MVVKLLLLVLVVLVAIVMGTSTGEEQGVIKYRVLPDKIHKGDEFLVEIYFEKGGKTVLADIPSVEIESLDTSIIEKVLEIEHPYKKQFRLKAIEEGTTSIYVYAKGYESLEIPITTYGDIAEPKELQIDIFPEEIEIDNNRDGVLFLSLTDDSGNPTKADRDYLVKIITSKAGIIALQQRDVIIPKGESSIFVSFKAINEGDVTITAKSTDFRASLEFSVIDQAEESLKIFVIPDNLNSFKSSSGYIIAQYYKDDKLSYAPRDIVLHYRITAEDEVVTNTSSQTSELNPVGYFQIDKGYSWGITKFSVQEGVSDNYVITLTSQDPLTVTEKTFSTDNTELFDDKKVQFSPVPVLADGKRQLLGVVFLEDENGNPVIADKDIVVSFASSSESLFVESSTIERGVHSALVYGKIVPFTSLDLSLTPKTENPKLVSLEAYGKEKEDISLKEFTPITSLLEGGVFWSVVYLETGDGEIIPFPKSELSVSEENHFSVDLQKVTPFSYFAVLPITSIDGEEGSVSVSVGEFEHIISLKATSSEPQKILFSYPEELFVGISDTFSIQLLNSNDQPINAKEDVEIKIFSSNPGVLSLSKNVTIQKGSNFVELATIPESEGSTEVSIISEGFPIVSEELSVQDTVPDLTITSDDIIKQDESVIVSVLAIQNGQPLRDSKVQWDISGAFSTIAEDKTGPTGEAVISLTPTSSENIIVDVTVENAFGRTATVSKEIIVNATQVNATSTEDSQPEVQKPTLFGLDPVLLMVPALVGFVAFYMKKKSK